ncbi:MAG: PrsW family glutamic-type intramembrane protease [Candidatus Caldarchaeum sp.]
MSSVICHSCSFVNQPNSLYCFRCGVPLTLIVCVNCRTQIPAYVSACPSCGYPVQRQRLSSHVPSMPMGHSYTDPSMRPRGGLADVFLLYTLLTKKRMPIYRASPAVYERLSPQTLARAGHYLTLTLIIFFIGVATASIILEQQGFAAMIPVSIVAALMPAVGFLGWMRLNDRLEPEPIWLVALAWGWGVFSLLPAVIVNDLLIPPLGWGGLAGFTEEPIKMLGVYLIATNPRLRSEFNDHLDGLLYGSAAGLGFAFSENILYVARNLQTNPMIVLLRVLAMSMHMFTTGLIGYWMGYLRVHGMTVSLPAVLPALAFAAFTHMLWNTIGQLPGDALLAVFFIWSPILVYYLSKIAREALVDEYFWGYGHGYAPKEGH